MGLDLAQLDIILTKLSSVGVFSAAYVGGEPAIRDDLEDIIRLTNNHRIIPSIITNGLLLDEKRIDQLFACGLGNMGFSLQSSNAEVHDQLVNHKHAHAKLMKGLEYCIRKKYTCSICVVPTNENLRNGDFQRMIDYAIRNGIRVNANLPASIGKLISTEDVLLDQESMNMLAVQYFTLDNFQPDFKQSTVPGKVYCPMGEYSIYIFPNGEVCPCTFTHVSFGNILHEPIKNIVARMKQSSLIKDIKRADCCPISMDISFIRRVKKAIRSSSVYPPRWND